jgi:hypothetical protein
MQSATANTPMIAPRNVIVTRATLSFPAELRHLAREMDGASQTLNSGDIPARLFSGSVGPTGIF